MGDAVHGLVREIFDVRAAAVCEHDQQALPKLLVSHARPVAIRP
jgi:hypothetical protein